MHPFAADNPKDWLSVTRALLEAEAPAIAAAVGRLNDNLAGAVQLIVNYSGMVGSAASANLAVSGRKIAATLASTGMPAVFLHAAEVVHGDLGTYTPGDPSIPWRCSGPDLRGTAEIPVPGGPQGIVARYSDHQKTWSCSAAPSLSS